MYKYAKVEGISRINKIERGDFEMRIKNSEKRKNYSYTCIFCEEKSSGHTFKETFRCKKQHISVVNM